MREDVKVFSNNLKAYMKIRNMAQAELAEKLGCTQSTVSTWIVGIAFPRIDKLDKMCEIFHCKRSDLMEREHTEKTILEQEQSKRLLDYFSRLNPDGVKKVIEYMEDLNERYMK